MIDDLGLRGMPVDEAFRKEKVLRDDLGLSGKKPFSDLKFPYDEQGTEIKTEVPAILEEIAEKPTKLTWTDVRDDILDGENRQRDPKVINTNRDGTKDIGLFQINERWLSDTGESWQVNADGSPNYTWKKIDNLLKTRANKPVLSKEEKQSLLFDPNVNEDVAQIIFDHSGQGAEAWFGYKYNPKKITSQIEEDKESLLEVADKNPIVFDQMTKPPSKETQSFLDSFVTQGYKIRGTVSGATGVFAEKLTNVTNYLQRNGGWDALLGPMAANPELRKMADETGDYTKVVMQNITDWYLKDAEHYNKLAEERGTNIVDAITADLIAAPVGIADFVSMKWLSFIDGAAQAEARGDNQLYGALKEGVSRQLLGGIFHGAGMLKKPVSAVTTGVLFAGQTAMDGGTVEQVLQSGITGTVMGVAGGGNLTLRDVGMEIPGVRSRTESKQRAEFIKKKLDGLQKDLADEITPTDKQREFEAREEKKAKEQLNILDKIELEDRELREEQKAKEQLDAFDRMELEEREERQRSNAGKEYKLINKMLGEEKSKPTTKVKKEKKPKLKNDLKLKPVNEEKLPPSKQAELDAYDQLEKDILAEGTDTVESFEGKTIYHVTLEENLSGIRKKGVVSSETLAFPTEEGAVQFANEMSKSSGKPTSIIVVKGSKDWTLKDNRLTKKGGIDKGEMIEVRPVEAESEITVIEDNGIKQQKISREHDEYSKTSEKVMGVIDNYYRNNPRGKADLEKVRSLTGDYEDQGRYLIDKDSWDILVGSVHRGGGIIENLNRYSLTIGIPIDVLAAKIYTSRHWTGELTIDKESQTQLINWMEKALDIKIDKRSLVRHSASDLKFNLSNGLHKLSVDNPVPNGSKRIYIIRTGNSYRIIDSPNYARQNEVFLNEWETMDPSRQDLSTPLYIDIPMKDYTLWKSGEINGNKIEGVKADPQTGKFGDLKAWYDDAKVISTKLNYLSDKPAKMPVFDFSAKSKAYDSGELKENELFERTDDAIEKLFNSGDQLTLFSNDVNAINKLYTEYTAKEKGLFEYNEQLIKSVVGFFQSKYPETFRKINNIVPVTIWGSLPQTTKESFELSVRKKKFSHLTPKEYFDSLKNGAFGWFDPHTPDTVYITSGVTRKGISSAELTKTVFHEFYHLYKDMTAGKQVAEVNRQLYNDLQKTTSGNTVSKLIKESSDKVNTIWKGTRGENIELKADAYGDYFKNKYLEAKGLTEQETNFNRHVVRAREANDLVDSSQQLLPFGIFEVNKLTVETKDLMGQKSAPAHTSTGSSPVVSFSGEGNRIVGETMGTMERLLQRMDREDGGRNRGPVNETMTGLESTRVVLEERLAKMTPEDQVKLLRSMGKQIGWTHYMKGKIADWFRVPVWSEDIAPLNNVLGKIRRRHTEITSEAERRLAILKNHKPSPDLTAALIESTLSETKIGYDKLSPKEKKIFTTIRGTMEYLYKEYRREMMRAVDKDGQSIFARIAKASGMTPKEYVEDFMMKYHRDFYFPLIREDGNYVVYASRGDKTLWAENFKSPKEAQKRAEELNAHFDEADIITEIFDVRSRFNQPIDRLNEMIYDVEGLKDTLVKGGSNPKEVDRMVEIMRGEYLKVWAKGRMAPRKGIPGFSGDIRNVLDNYVRSFPRSFVRKLNLHKIAAEVQALPRDRRAYGNNLVDFYLGKADHEGRANFAIRSVIYNYTLALKGAFAILNMNQRNQTTLWRSIAEGGFEKGSIAAFRGQLKEAALWKELTQSEAKNIGSRLMGQKPNWVVMREAILKSKILDKQDKVILTKLYDRGELESIRNLEIVGKSKLSRGLNILATLSERSNRTHAALTALDIGKGKGLKGEALFDFTIKFIDKTQWQYRKENRPEIGRGWKAPLFVFKSYVLNDLNFLRDLSGMDKRAFSGAVATRLLFAGVGGVYGAGLITAIIDAVMAKIDPYWEITKQETKAQMKEAGGMGYDILMNGVTYPLGIQGSITFGSPELFDIAGASLAKKMWFDLRTLEAEGLSNMDKSTFARRISPSSIKHLMEWKTTDLFGRSMITESDIDRLPRDIRERAREIYNTLPNEMGKTEKWIYAVGFATKTPNEFYEAVSAIRTVSDRVQKEISRYHREIAKAIVEGNGERADKLRDEMVSKGYEVSMQSISKQKERYPQFMKEVRD